MQPRGVLVEKEPGFVEAATPDMGGAPRGVGGWGRRMGKVAGLVGGGVGGEDPDQI